MNKKVLYLSMMAAVLLASAVASTVVIAEAEKNKHHGKPDVFTRRISESFADQSASHDAENHSSHQAMYFVHPVEGKVYDGRITFSSTKPVDILVYHDVTGADTTGLTVHKVDGRSYAVTVLMKEVTSGTADFVGAGILAHTAASDQFTVAASVNAIGWNDQAHLPNQ